MAIRLVVEYPNLQVSVKTQEVSLTVETAQSNAPSLQTHAGTNQHGRIESISKSVFTAKSNCENIIHHYEFLGGFSVHLIKV